MTALSKKAKLSKKTKVKYNRADTRAAWLLLLPSVIGLTCITYLPMLASFTLSLFSWNGLGDMTYVGADNYIRLFTRDTKFYGSLLTTLEYAGIAVIGSVVIHDHRHAAQPEGACPGLFPGDFLSALRSSCPGGLSGLEMAVRLQPRPVQLPDQIGRGHVGQVP